MSTGTAFTLCLSFVADFDRREVFERVIAQGVENVEQSDSVLLADFHEKLLVSSFSREEVEPLEKLQQELDGNRNSDASARYLCTLLRDLGNDGQIASGAYASVQEGVLAIRFVVTCPGYRGTGLSQELVRLLLTAANRWSIGRGQTIRACVGECVTESETFFNRVLGMRRLYVPGTDERSLHEIHYELPHLGDWADDGNPIDPAAEPKREHLQIAVAGDRRVLTFEQLEVILTSFWREWYLWPRERRVGAGWESHWRQVMIESLQGRILEPLRSQQTLILLSREEREERNKNGWAIRELV